MIHFHTSIDIDRPRTEVFGPLADPTTYPRWNSAVDDVVPLERAGSYQMRRQLPTGPAINLLEIIEAVPPEEVVVRASDGPTPFIYRYRLTDHESHTQLDLDADVDLGGVLRLIGPLAERAVRAGVDENLGRLKRLVEAA